MARAIHRAQNLLVIERELTLANRSTMELAKALTLGYKHRTSSTQLGN